MNDDRVSEGELNALVDGELDPARQAQVEAQLAENPDAARRVARYRAQNAGLHALYDDLLHEEMPEAIVTALAGRRRPAVPAWAAMAAAIALLVAGGAGGWVANDLMRPEPAPVAQAGPPIDTQELMVRAAMAHVVSDRDDLVRPASGDMDQLGEYITTRMGVQVRVPRLESFGYHLMGCRILPDTDGPAAQFVYENDAGEKVSLYVRTEKARGVDITYALADDLSMFYWNDSSRSYALVTHLDDKDSRSALLNAARAVYGQLVP